MHFVLLSDKKMVRNSGFFALFFVLFLSETRRFVAVLGQNTDDVCGQLLPSNNESQCSDNDEYADCTFKQMIELSFFQNMITCETGAANGLCLTNPQEMYPLCCTACKTKTGTDAPTGIPCQDHPDMLITALKSRTMTCAKLRLRWGCAGSVTGISFVKAAILRGCKKEWYTQCRNTLSDVDMSDYHVAEACGTDEEKAAFQQTTSGGVRVRADVCMPVLLGAAAVFAHM
eukprot:GDKI01019340.1.p1 GENE.GDKI01019340.1~~GDKI01019340.1.p1  ORF type:complete len:230 (+),score=34.47 GDKI01019340.1:34-723(+)